MNIRGKTEQVWFFALAALSMHVSAQCHFTFTPNTGNNMTVLVRTSINPNINGEPLEAGDEIGVFNRNGLCAGSIQWNQENAAITVWGDNDQTDPVDGIAVNDTMRFHVWDKSQSQELAAIVTFENESHLTYAADRIAKLQTLTVQFTRTIPQNGLVLLRNDRDRITVTLYDLRGKTVARFTGIGTGEEIVERIKKRGLPRGRYFAAIQTGGSRIIHLPNVVE
jgi:hypothetical protein